MTTDMKLKMLKSMTDEEDKDVRGSPPTMTGTGVITTVRPLFVTRKDLRKSAGITYPSV